MKISTLARNAMLNALAALVDGGSGAGTLKFFTGAAPTNTTDADSGTLLATLTFSDPAFGASSGGVITASAVTSDSAVDASGTPQHFRIKDSDGVCVAQGSVGTSGADINFDSTTWVAGGIVAVSSLTITQPTGS